MIKTFVFLSACGDVLWQSAYIQRFFACFMLQFAIVVSVFYQLNRQICHVLFTSIIVPFFVF